MGVLNTCTRWILINMLLMANSCDSLLLETPTLLNHLIKFANNTRLLVGAVNHLYMVDSNLNVIQNVSTGPVIDSKHCSSSSCSNGVMTDNYNKLLVLYNEELITCGNVRQGTCEMRRIQNLSEFTAHRSTKAMVAANTPEASTVGVIVPGKNAICVGATMTEGYGRFDFSVISTRRLVDFRIVRHSQLRAQNDYGSKISYKFAFHLRNYSYFLVGDEYHRLSKIARICEDDWSYYSYIEIPLECKHGITIYDSVQTGTIAKLGPSVASHVGVSIDDDVLVTVFHRRGVTEYSAICLYRISDIIDKINENGNECFKKGRFTNASYYIQGNSRCKATSVDYSNISCGELAYDLDYFRNTPVVGKIPVSSTMAFEVGSRLTSILVKTIGNHTVVYAGTISGQLKKIHVKSSTESKTFKSVTLGDKRAMEDMVFDDVMEHIYVMSGTKLHKIATYECNLLTSCAECVGSRDPHCGWCTLENKCSLSSECKAKGVPKKWYNYDADVNQCITFSNIKPTDSVSVHAAEHPINLSLSISNLPQDNSFTCVFGESTFTPATKTPFGVRCITPRWTLVHGNDDHVTIPLSLNSSETGILFISKSFTFFSCEFLKTCTTCARSQWGCLWCVYDHKCVHPTDNVECKPGNVTSESLCPRIDASTLPIKLPSGFKKGFVLRTKELPSPMNGQTGYECKIHVDDRTFTTSVAVQGDTVTCLGNTEYHYYESVQRKKVLVSLVWNGVFQIDNPNNVRAEMYKCPLLGPECGICHNLSESYQCAWSSKCVYTPSGVKSPCPFIDVRMVRPLNTTIEGGTLVTLSGMNLGYSAASVKKAVTLAGVLCESIDDGYVVSHKIVCRAGRRAHAAAGEIIVKVDGVIGKFSNIFSYKNPTITEVFPQIGPKSGGTEITIKGQSLETCSWFGLHISLSHIPCHLLSRSEKEVVCLLDGVEIPRSFSPFMMGFENQAKRISHASYWFTPDPTIRNIAPLASIVGGGRSITVIGTHFKSIQRPVMFVHKDDGTRVAESTPCIVRNDSLMWCSSPTLHSARSPTDVSVGFIMDNVTTVRRLSENFANVSSVMTYVSNPEYFNFTEVDLTKTISSGTKELLLMGSNLNLACAEEEVIVLIGKVPCNVTGLARTRLLCKLPDRQPYGLDERGRWSKDILPQVSVTVGNLNFHIGKLQYYATSTDVGLIVGTVIAVAALLAIIAGVVFIFRRKLVKTQRANRKMQLELVSTKLKQGGRALTEENPAPSRTPLDEQTWLLVKESNILVESSDIDVDETCVLGQGNFGCVFKGILRREAESIEVAVKAQRDTYISCGDSVSKILNEALIMREFHHENVLGLLGIRMESRNDSPLVILPFMRHGDLLSYIKDPKKALSVFDLVKFGVDIAKGMEYLSDLKFVHRDLAARNCMLGDDNVVKVADFGLSRDVYERDYYSSEDRKAKLPVKWMALESLTEAVYTTKSDVWSYGVVLWELLTRGVFPYPEVDNWDIKRYLENDRRLPQPEFCPKRVYNIMRQCWLLNPSDRPSFAELANHLQALITPTLADASVEDCPTENPYVSLDRTTLNKNLPVNSYAYESCKMD